MRYPRIALLIVCLLLAASCLNLKLPTTEEVEQIFVENIDVEVEGKEVPPHVPMLHSSELGGWRMLCDECHIGPAYSSYTNIEWGHLDSCLADISCFSCHGEDLHRMDVRGQKQYCYECHIESEVSVTCLTCHSEQHVAAQSIHAPNFLGSHGSNAVEMNYECYNCHGSENWCMSCHGVPMPHELDIIESHPDMVQGQPEICANCHGSQSCLRCHTAYGVDIQLN